MGAMVNHSCTPNAVQVFLGKSIHFRALHSIPAGDEVTIAYIEVRLCIPCPCQNMPTEALTLLNSTLCSVVSLLQLGQTRQERRAVLLDRYHFDINQV